MRTKQQVYDQREALDGLAVIEANKASPGFGRAWDEAFAKAMRNQGPLRVQLHSACLATSGHIFCGGPLCGICGYDKNTPARVTAQNLSKGA